MNRAVQVYRWLLRLYPRSFRADYADEMESVFRQAVEEDGGTFFKLLAEARDLPLSLIQAHLRESRRNRLIFQTEGLIMTITFKRTFAYCMWAVLLGSIVYTLLVVLPFFALGLHLQPENMVRGGVFDPKGYRMYGDGTYASILMMLTYIVMLLGPIWQMVFGGSLFITMARFWPFFPPRQHRIGLLAIFVSIGAIGFIFSPLGRLIMTWWLD